MAGSVNKVILIGNLGADPEIRRTQDGRPVANLRLATSESWKDKTTGERKEKTEWHRVVIFNENLCRIAERAVVAAISAPMTPAAISVHLDRRARSRPRPARAAAADAARWTTRFRSELSLRGANWAGHFGPDPLARNDEALSDRFFGSFLKPR
jgi:hypothetical protein